MPEPDKSDDATRVRPKEPGSTVAKALSTGTWGTETDRGCTLVAFCGGPKVFASARS